MKPKEAANMWMNALNAANVEALIDLYHEDEVNY